MIIVIIVLIKTNQKGQNTVQEVHVNEVKITSYKMIIPKNRRQKENIGQTDIQRLILKIAIRLKLGYLEAH